MNWSADIREEGYYWMRHPEEQPEPRIREIVRDLSGEGWFVLFPGVNIFAPQPSFEGWEFWGPLEPPGPSYLRGRGGESCLADAPHPAPGPTSARPAGDSSFVDSPPSFARTPTEELPGAEPWGPDSAWARS